VGTRCDRGRDAVRLPRQPDREGGSHWGPVACLQLAAVSLRNPTADGQPQPNARILRGHEGIEDPVAEFRRQAAPVIGNLHRNPRVRCRLPGDGRRSIRLGAWNSQPHGHAASGRDGVEGVQQQVQHELPHLVGIGLDDDRLRGHVAAEARALSAQPPRDQFGGLLQDSSQIGGLLLQGRRAGEVEKGLDRAFDAVDRLLQHGQIAPPEAARFPLGSRRLDEQLHGLQRISQFVRDACGKLSDGRQLFVAQHLPLAFLQPLDYRRHLLRQPLREGGEFLEFPAGEGDRTDYAAKPPGGVAHGHAQFH